MASFSLVHGAWGGGWLWELVRAELEARGHVVRAPDLPCQDLAAGVDEYAAAVPAADVVVGHSLGGLTIPFVEADTHVFLTALVAGTGWEGVFVRGFGDARIRDELGRSYYPDPVDAVRELQIPPEHAHLSSRLRHQAPYDPPPAHVERPAYIVCAHDAAISPEWQRHLARDVLGVEPLELDSGHSPMLERPHELAALLHALV
ncbi:MAG TPA: alpha/beta hydrolase [Gaiellaceae bacterium]|jgi:pimeloyl-ACP methyl ester carboxylesterase